MHWNFRYIQLETQFQIDCDSIWFFFSGCWLWKRFIFLNSWEHIAHGSSTVNRIEQKTINNNLRFKYSKFVDISPHECRLCTRQLYTSMPFHPSIYQLFALPLAVMHHLFVIRTYASDPSRIVGRDTSHYFMWYACMLCERYSIYSYEAKLFRKIQKLQNGVELSTLCCYEEDLLVCICVCVLFWQNINCR